MAVKYGVSRSVLSLAWLLKHPSQIIPIVGSSNPQRIKEAVLADSVELSRDDWYRLLVVARGEKLP
jgi:predicted oxidoreductase